MLKGDDSKIALFDMDGVLCDYFNQLSKDLNKLKSPLEPKVKDFFADNNPQYIKERIKLIKQSEDWWANLPKLKIGHDILNLAKKMKFRIVILSKTPSKNPSAYSGKKKWVERYLGEGTEVILTEDKGMVYGRILVDDFPGFIVSWLKYRPRGLVIMPANKQNRKFKHPQVIRYTGKNLKQVRMAMEVAKKKSFIEVT